MKKGRINKKIRVHALYIQFPSSRLVMSSELVPTALRLCGHAARRCGRCGEERSRGKTEREHRCRKESQRTAHTSGLAVARRASGPAQRRSCVQSG